MKTSIRTEREIEELRRKLAEIEHQWQATCEALLSANEECERLRKTIHDPLLSKAAEVLGGKDQRTATAMRETIVALHDGYAKKQHTCTGDPASMADCLRCLAVASKTRPS